jgi:hypothetical protein
MKGVGDLNNSLNAMFRTVSEYEMQNKPNKQQEDQISPGVKQIATKEKERVRKERADKEKDIKFPVTPEQREELRRLAKGLKVKNRDPGRKYETISNTHVLKKAFDHYLIFKEQFPPLIYKDTGQYMHAAPLLRDFELIEQLSLKWNLSLRKTVYRLIMNFIFRHGEVDAVAYRAGK